MGHEHRAVKHTEVCVKLWSHPSFHREESGHHGGHSYLQDNGKTSQVWMRQLRCIPYLNAHPRSPSLCLIICIDEELTCSKAAPSTFERLRRLFRSTRKEKQFLWPFPYQSFGPRDTKDAP